jgi:lipid-A-disaccharide synthase
VTRVFVSAGEPSGDAHAAAVVRHLRRRQPDAIVDGIGGPALVAAGATLLADAGELAAVGLVEAARSLPTHLRVLARVQERFAERRYDVVLLVDYPGFNLRLARIAAVRQTPVLYYIAPQLWAWGQWRASSLRRRVRKIAVVLPFEEEFFTRHGITASFVGHPLLDAPPPPPRADARRALGLDPEAPVLAVLPGSRRSELDRLWPRFRQAAEALRASQPDLQVVVATPGAAMLAGVAAFDAQDVDATAALSAADAALCKSGTVTLEAALADVPMVIAYRVHPLTFAVARPAVRVRHIGLVNLVAGRPVAPEYLQSRATPARLAEALRPLLDDAHPETRAQRRALAEVRAALGSPGAAERVSRMVLELAA